MCQAPDFFPSGGTLITPVTRINVLFYVLNLAGWQIRCRVSPKAAFWRVVLVWYECAGPFSFQFKGKNEQGCCSKVKETSRPADITAQHSRGPSVGNLVSSDCLEKLRRSMPSNPLIHNALILACRYRETC